jgi:hypothetical protein
MFNFRRRSAQFTVGLVLLSVLAACSPDASRSLVAPPATQPQAGLISGLLGGVFRLLGGVLSLVTTTAPRTESATVSVVIGSAGGSLTIPNVNGSGVDFRLTVPSRAVSGPTRFTMTALPGSFKIVDLTATASTLLGTVDVGSRGFAVPVKLEISKSNLSTTSKPLGIVLVLPDGRIQEFPSNESGSYVTANLPHFSRWALATQ